MSESYIPIPASPAHAARVQEILQRVIDALNTEGEDDG